VSAACWFTKDADEVITRDPDKRLDIPLWTGPDDVDWYCPLEVIDVEARM
jgi:hypothetical protein